MEFFLDTANLDAIKKYNEWGIIDGVTTNPSLIAKEGVSLEKRIKEKGYGTKAQQRYLKAQGKKLVAVKITDKRFK